MKVKLCGFTEKESLNAAIKAGCDFIGFVFYKKSPRFITVRSATDLASKIPDTIGKVAVLVDPDFELLAEISENFSPDFFQFHGKENENFLREVRKKFPQTKIIKAFRLNEANGTTSSGRINIEQIQNFENVADFFLFDSPNPGSGKSFRWEILKNFCSKKDWFLSGGLSINNIDDAVKITGAKMIDISSGIERSRGQKSPELIYELMAKVRQNAS